MKFHHFRVGLHAALLTGLLTLASRGDINYQKCVLNMSDYDDPHNILYKTSAVFAGLSADGIIGIIHRCTLGTDGADVDFADCKKAAQSQHLLWGAYHFGKQGEDPVKQADLFIATLVQGHQSTDEPVLLVLDEEYFHPRNGGVRFMSPRDAAAFVQRIYDRTGVYPGIYTGRDFLKEKLNRDQLDEQGDAWATLRHCWLWVAKYASEPPESDPWSEWNLWQYTGDGLGAHSPNLPESVPSLGLKQAELNIFSGSSDDARAFWQDHAWNYQLKPGRSLTSAAAP
jgi:lysozyme